MGFESWIAFAFALLVALAVPGPDLVLVVHCATRGVREGASTAAGIVTGLMLHALLTIAGVTAILLSAPGALTAVQLLGAAILLWMGTTMLRSKPGTAVATDQAQRGGFARGFLTNATNPKALLFFAAILPQFVGRGAGTQMRTLLLCVTIVLAAGLWWTVTIIVVRSFGFHRSPRADRAITHLGGAALLIIGLGLLATTVITITAAGQ